MKPHHLLAAMAMMGLTSLASCSTQPGADNDAENNGQAVIENIMTRTSVRQFTSQPIPDDTIEILLKAGMAAPTAKNIQPWSFVVVTDRAVLDSLESVHPYSNLKTATAAIVVCGDMTKYDDDTLRQYWIQDCSAATENILLAAHAMGLGAVWCGVYPSTDRVSGVRHVLSLPGNIMPLNLITMGYPQGENTPKDKWNPQVVHYQKW
ncbi:MAG: nitroreductase family protein [Muribaculaceae bacterium]|nr:nitroreductase family protein [Muribaculaceae bacterium]